MAGSDDSRSSKRRARAWRWRWLLFLPIALGGNRSVMGESPAEAQVSYSINKVTTTGSGVSRAATPGEAVADGARIATGEGSRAELRFRDGTVVRLGADTAVVANARGRGVTLEAGTVLIAAPRGHGPLRLETGGLRETLNGGTMLVHYTPKKGVKAALLEGDLRVSVRGFLGDSVVIPPGKMLITAADAARIPDSVDVDLETLAKSSSLIEASLFLGKPAGPEGTLASAPLLARECERQKADLRRKKLIPTNLVINGSGTQVVIPKAAAPVESPAGEPAQTAKFTRAETSAAPTGGAGELEGIASPLP